jgi:CRISPR-associated protein Cmr5
VLIRTAGLAQALGFLDAKSSEEMNKRLLNDLADTLGKSRNQLLEESRGDAAQSLGDYLRLTQDALAALLWYKRFAQSVLDVDAGEQGEN